jgi:molybdopterin synthase sulfur carrier subunit
VTVLYFAALRDLAGLGEEQLDVAVSDSDASSAAAPELSVSALLQSLEERHSALRGRLETVRVAVNEEFTELSTVLRGGEVVALIPPVSGG